MSIKRSKQRGGRRDAADEHYGFSRPNEPEKSFEEHLEGKADEDFLPYALSARFEKGALIQHAKFGRGVVLMVEGSHMEVLFSEGRKKLGHAIGQKD